MLFRFTLSLAAILCLAQQPASAEVLPRQMLGTWAPDAAACENDESEGRVKVEPRWIESYADGYSIRTWIRRGNVWHGRGRHAQEGEGGTMPGKVALRMMPDARLEMAFNGHSGSLYVKCPRDRGVR
jgi:hypothetical protein